MGTTPELGEPDGRLCSDFRCAKLPAQCVH